MHTREDIKQSVELFLSELFAFEGPLDETKSLEDQGLTSLDAVELVMMFEQQYKTYLDDNECWQVASLPCNQVIDRLTEIANETRTT